MLKKVYKAKQQKPLRILMMSNGPEIPTGYGRVLREIALRLNSDYRFEVIVFNENRLNHPDYEYMGLKVVCPEMDSNKGMNYLYEGIS